MTKTMELQPLQKLIIQRANTRTNGRVIGIKPEADGSTSYLIQPLRVDFYPHKNSRILKINSKDIDNEQLNIEIH